MDKGDGDLVKPGGVVVAGADLIISPVKIPSRSFMAPADALSS